MKEIWKESTLVDRLEVSNLGNVRNKSDKKHRYLTKHKKGYLYVYYKISGKRHSVKVHRLVATEFCDNPQSKLEVNHIDADKANNFYENLEWATHQENMDHAYALGLVPALKGSLNGRALINEDLVHKICQDYVDGVTPKDVIRKYSLTRNQAIKIKSKLTWKHITQQYKY